MMSRSGFEVSCRVGRMIRSFGVDLQVSRSPVISVPEFPVLTLLAETRPAAINVKAKKQKSTVRNFLIIDAFPK